MNTKTDEYLPVVDISKFQQSLDAAKMASTGVVALFIRTSDGISTSGRQGLDPRWPEFLREAASSPLLVGSYHFWRPQLSGATEQARFWLQAVRRGVDKIGRPLDLPLLADVEFYTDTRQLAGPAAVRWLREFLDVVEDEGGDLVVQSARTPAIYTGASFWQTFVDNSDAFGRHGLVLARYPTQTTKKNASGQTVLDANGRPTIVDRTPPRRAAEWAEFAWTLTKKRSPAPPLIPGFRRWDGWQFSGDGNAAGAQVGVGSPHVDCNIFLAETLRRWSGRTLGGSNGATSTTTRPTTRVTSSSADPTEVIVNALPNIRPGASGDAVKRVQALLLAAGFDPGPLDGTYREGNDSPTFRALTRFQAARGLTADGRVGVKQTWPALLGL